MKSKTPINAIIKTLILITITLYGANPTLYAQTDQIEQNPPQFLSSLEGTWIGQAEITPLGPLNYNITFKRTNQSQIEGAARLKAATHYWTFYEDNNQLKLRFLTIFRGNTTPIYLEVREWNQEGVLFQAKKPELLSGRVTPSADQLLIYIFHWDKLHVSIRLNKVETGSEM